MFAIEHWGIKPDLITVGKSIAGGMPLSAVVGSQEIMDSVHPGGIGGTFGGNPVCCAAALAVLDVYEEERILEKGEILGTRVRAFFESLKDRYEIIGDVRGLGPMLALELVKDRETKEPDPESCARVVQQAFAKGLNIVSCGQYGNIIRTMMPLVITDSQLDKGLSILDEAFAVLKR
jgi:4-aminobutyrate aminotransferase / (S)-3-amino-2-methylpropionate transaminase / 5-aminovalerate transaminase